MKQATLIQVHELRACELCSNHCVLDDELHCTHAMVVGAQKRVPCRLARYGQDGGIAGGCGRDARHFQWPAIEMPERKRAPSEWALA